MKATTFNAAEKVIALPLRCNNSHKFLSNRNFYPLGFKPEKGITYTENLETGCTAIYAHQMHTGAISQVWSTSVSDNSYSTCTSMIPVARTVCSASKLTGVEDRSSRRILPRHFTSYPNIPSQHHTVMFILRSEIVNPFCTLGDPTFQMQFCNLGTSVTQNTAKSAYKMSIWEGRRYFGKCKTFFSQLRKQSNNDCANALTNPPRNPILHLSFKKEHFPFNTTTSKLHFICIYIYILLLAPF